MKTFLVVFIISLVGPTLCAQVFPGTEWQVADDPADYGYSLAGLKKAEEYANGLNTAATIVVVDGVIIYEWGQVNTKYLAHSVRKSMASILFGNYVEKGLIDVDKTLGEIGIDDVPKLTEREKTATIRDCLKARSCVYHDCILREGSKAKGPPDLKLPPGTHFLYNNWDFNVLGTILEQSAGKDIFQVLEEDIAQPIRMESFTAADGWKMTGDASIHASYPLKITARDLARFGVLMLNKGNWNGKQVVPAEWVEECTTYHSDATRSFNDGYGYMWWVAKKNNKYPHYPNVEVPLGSYSARGRGGHHMLVVPSYDLVIVHRVDTFKEGNAVSKEDFGSLVKMIFDAKLPANE